jgi:hypothetical protein
MAIPEDEAQLETMTYLNTKAETDPAVLATDAFWDDLRAGKSEEDLPVFEYFIEQIKFSASQQPAE